MIYDLRFIYYFTILHQPSSISHHPSSFSHHPSAIIHHPSAIFHHPSSLQRYEKLAVVGRHDEAPTDA